MNNPNFQDQFEAAKQLAQQKGISGVAYIDFNPAKGFLRLKLKVTPPEFQSMLTSNFVNALVQGSQMFGLQIKTHQSNGEELWSNPLFTLYPEIGLSHAKKLD